MQKQIFIILFIILLMLISALVFPMPLYTKLPIITADIILILFLIILYSAFYKRGK